MTRRKWLAAALAVAAVFLVVTTVLQLTHDAPRIAGSNDVAPASFVVESPGGGTRVCQAGETLWEATAALELTIGTYGRPGPPLALTVERGAGDVIARGGLDHGWQQGVVRVPLDEPAQRTVSDVTVCFSTERGGRLAWGGEPVDPPAAATVDGQPTSGRLSLVSFEPGERSLLEVAGRIADRYAAGNAAWLGGWTLIVIAVAAVAALLAAGAALWHSGRGAGRRVPPSGWLSAAAALFAALAWALLVPPFHVPDEVSHVAYVQSIVEEGELPVRTQEEPYSRQEQDLLAGLQFYGVIGRAEDKPPWSPAEERRLRDLAGSAASRATTDAGTASANPPLYYLLQAPVYAATRWSSLLAQQLPMRLVSVLLAAVTALLIFLFLRELLPRSPWTWSAGALVAALQPVVAFMSAGVNPDALLFACSAAVFLGIARLLRRGLSPANVAILCGAVAAGLLTKPLFLALVPAAAAAVMVALVRAWRAGARPGRIAKLGAAAAGLAAAPVVVYHVVGLAVFEHGYFERRAPGVGVGLVAGAAPPGTGDGSLRHEISYIWQLFLPRAPWMNDLFPGERNLPLREVWFDGLVGRFGWLDYGFDRWVTDLAVDVALLVLVAAAVTLVVHRAELRGRWLELGCYVLAAVGVVAAIGTRQWLVVRFGGDPFTQPRYLLPLLALYAALAALAVRLPGRRAGPLAAVALVAIAGVHHIGSLLLTTTRYYT